MIAAMRGTIITTMILMIALAKLALHNRSISLLLLTKKSNALFLIAMIVRITTIHCLLSSISLLPIYLISTKNKPQMNMGNISLSTNL